VGPGQRVRLRRRRGGPVDATADVPGADLTPTTWGACRDGAEVALWTIEGGAHVPAFTPTATESFVDWLEDHARRP